LKRGAGGTAAPGRGEAGSAKGSKTSTGAGDSNIRGDAWGKSVE